MGIYTKVRGWISLKDSNTTNDSFEAIMVKVGKLSMSLKQCVISTVFNKGFEFSDYIFIGGAIKNCDDDWDKYLQFIRDSFKISEYNIEMKTEQQDDWHKVVLEDL